MLAAADLAEITTNIAVGINSGRRVCPAAAAEIK